MDLEQVERTAAALHGDPWEAATEWKKNSYRRRARLLLQTHAVTPLADHAALVRAAALSDARERERVALAEQCAALRRVAFAVITWTGAINDVLPGFAKAIREPLETWMQLTDPQAATEARPE